MIEVLKRRGHRARLLDYAFGAFAVLALAPFQIWPAILVALAWLYARLVHAGSSRAGFSRGFWWALGYFSFGMFWIASAFVARGPEYIPLIIPLVLGLFVLLSLFWGLAGWVYVRLSPRVGRSIAFRLLPPGVFTALFFLAEMIRGHLFGGFPWNLPGYAFAAGTPLSQAASLWSVWGQTFVVLGLGGVIGHAVIARPRSLEWLAAFKVVGVLGLLVGFGSWRLSGAEVAFRDDVTLRLVAVPFDQSEKFDPGASLDVVNAYLSQSYRPGIEDVTHLIWPEGAVTGVVIENEPLLSTLGASLRGFDDTPPIWMFSTVRVEMEPQIDGPPRTRYYNAVAAVDFDDRGYPAVLSTNDKRRLVPFGEIVPFSEFFASLGYQGLTTATTSFTAAPKKTVMSVPGLGTFSPQICYEIIFAGLTPEPETGDAAPAFILNQSNDAWFGDSAGPAQHAAIAAMRAVETGLPVVRAAANGVSGTVDPWGRWIVRVEADETGIRDVSLPVSVYAVRDDIGANKNVASSTWGRLAFLLLSLCLVSASAWRRAGDATLEVSQGS